MDLAGFFHFTIQQLGFVVEMVRNLLKKKFITASSFNKFLRIAGRQEWSYELFMKLTTFIHYENEVYKKNEDLFMNSSAFDVGKLIKKLK